MPVRFTVKFDGVEQTRAAFARMPADASRELDQAKRDIASKMARYIAAAARSSDAQSAAVAKTVKAQGPIGRIVAGGNQLVTSQSRRSSGQGPTTADDLLYGANFGAHRLRQFRRFRGAGNDYWFFRTLDQNAERINQRWLEAMDNTLDRWAD